MRRSWALATVGALVLVVGGLTYFLVVATKDGGGKNEGYRVWARFHDAAGLFQKSRVQTAGISIGQIDERKLDPDMPLARITIRLQPGVTLWENAVVSKKSASLLGEFYLEIDPGTPTDNEGHAHRKMKDGDQINRVIEPVSMGEIMSNVGTILPILKDILQDVRTLTAGPIASAAENVNKMIETNSVVLERLLTKVDHIAGDIESVTHAERDDVRVAISNVRDITEAVKRLVGTSEGEVAGTGTKIRSSLDKLQATVDNLDRTLNNLEKVTGRMEKGEGTVGHLLNDDTIARNVEEITEDAGGLVRSITKLQTIVGLRGEYNFLSNEFKEYLSITLMPRPDKFYLIEIVNDPRGFRETFTSNSFSSTRGYDHTTTTTYSEKLRYTLQFGKTFFGLVSGRFGIKESTGGVGLDLHLLQERLLFSLDVFDTRFNKYPRVQARAAYALYQRSLYILGGIDDIINERATQGAGGGFDWFLGAQLMFNDEDSKSLLLFGSSSIGGATK